jgi:hypothetical protein
MASRRTRFRAKTQRRKGGETGGLQLEFELLKRQLCALASLREKS